MSDQPTRFPDDLRQAEDKLITARRKLSQQPAVGPKAPVAGLALSGGGIRSATFNLGILQALARRGLLRRFDFLSTVSGGGYIGSFFGAWVNRHGIDAAEEGLKGMDGQSEGSLPVRYLRENGRYLTPNGSTDAWLAACQQVRSQFTVLFLLLLPVLGTILLAEGCKSLLRVLPESLQADSPVLSIFWPAVGAFALVALLPLATGYWFIGALGEKAKSASRVGLLFCLLAAGWLAAAFWWPAAGTFAWAAVVPLAVAVWFTGGTGRRTWRTSLAVLSLYLLWLGAFAFAAQRFGAFFGSWDNLLPATWSFADVRPWGRELVERSWKGGFLAATLGALAVTMVLVVSRAAGVSAAGTKAARRWYTDRLAVFARYAVFAALFATVDTLAQWFAREIGVLSHAAAGPVTLAAVVAVAQRLGPWLAGLGEGSRLKLPAQALAWIAAVLAASAIVIGFAATVHLAAINRLAPMVGGGHLMPAAALLGLGGFFWGVAWVCGGDFRFVNHSSMHRLYSSRLTRAYVGASNPHRTGTTQGNFDATEVTAGDDVAWKEYRPDAKGGPLHLVNVTVNETVSGQSNVDKEDRRGLGMAIGPVALSVGPRASIAAGGEPTEGAAAAQKTAEAVAALSLGEWVGVSGAAFTTGMGANTSLPLSFLLSLFNVRLGFWWNSHEVCKHAGIYPGKIPARRRMADYARSQFPAQDALVDEMTAQFHGPTRKHWYLSDGGHFENTACYELIRRQVPLIVCCDCGADPEYTFEDVANLVRKARIDFGAEIEFLDAEKAKVFSPALGSLAELRPAFPESGKDEAAVSEKHGAIARITHRNGESSVLLLIKPTLSADAPIDLLQYDSKDRSFPQQTTLDQFFDEAQWESHRKLGVFIGEKIFADTDAPGAAPLWNHLIEYARTGTLPRAAAPAPAGGVAQPAKAG